MSAQQLNAKSVRRIARATGLPVIGGWSHGGYNLGFVTEDHRHGVFDKKTGEWWWEEPVSHYTSCHERFGDYPAEPPLPPPPVAAHRPMYETSGAEPRTKTGSILQEKP